MKVTQRETMLAAHALPARGVDTDGLEPVSEHSRVTVENESPKPRASLGSSMHGAEPAESTIAVERASLDRWVYVCEGEAIS